MDIKLLVMDVDGTLTDGKIYMSAGGELMKAFNIKDGYAIARMKEYGIEPVIITGRESDIVKQRCAELKIMELYQGVENKLFKLKDICAKKGLTLSQVAYIGDDVNDLPCILHCGMTACPADAVNKVKKSADVVTEAKGGEGAVREFCEYLVEKCCSRGNDEIADYEFSEIKFEEQ